MAEKWFFKVHPWQCFPHPIILYGIEIGTRCKPGIYRGLEHVGCACYMWANHSGSSGQWFNSIANTVGHDNNNNSNTNGKSSFCLSACPLVVYVYTGNYYHCTLAAAINGPVVWRLIVIAGGRIFNWVQMMRWWNHIKIRRRINNK